MNTQRLRIIVTGLIAQHPQLGGVAWDYLQYPLGLHRLGHDVYYIEDSGEWPYTVDGGPSANDWIARDPSVNARHLKAVMERFGLGDRWAYRFPIEPKWFGLTDARRRQIVRSADLVINVSGSLKRPWEYRAARRLAYIDSDPTFTQIKLALPKGQTRLKKRVAAHDVHFSFGERLADTAVPGELNWRPTRQPIVLEEWRPERPAGTRYTTVMSWTSYRPLKFQGEYYAQKDVEFRKFLELPSRVAIPLEVAMNETKHVNWERLGPPDADDGAERRAQPRSTRDLLEAAGWHFADARAVGATVDTYRNYIEGSRGEWSVAKNGYVRGQSGWFSCRSACYLAAGRPVVVQDTGFSSIIPTGRGLFAFSSLEEAAAALTEVERDYVAHSAAARDIASGYFAAPNVLSTLIESAMNPAPDEARLVTA